MTAAAVPCVCVCLFFANARLRCKAELMGAISYTLCAMDAINLLISRTRRGRGTLHSWVGLAWPDRATWPDLVPYLHPAPELELRDTANHCVVLIPSLRCAYNENTKNKAKKNTRKFAKRSLRCGDMNFFIKKMKERQESRL